MAPNDAGGGRVRWWGSADRCYASYRDHDKAKHCREKSSPLHSGDASAMLLDRPRGPTKSGTDRMPMRMVTSPHMTRPATQDDDALRRYASVLATGIEEALAPWVVRSVSTLADAWKPGLGQELEGLTAEAARRATREVGPRVRALLEADVDAQRTGPLALVREAVVYPTEVLRRAGVGLVVRDEFSERAFPADVFGLAPASFADLDPALHEPGLIWGAAKAHVVLARRRAEGMR